MLIFSFLVVAFGQAIYHPVIATCAALFGYALFWWRYQGVRYRFLTAWAWGSGVAAVQLFWLATPHYQGAFIVVAYALLVLSLGALFACFARCVTKRALSTIHGCLALAGLWVLIEWGRLFFLCGYAWNPVGLALGATLLGRQMASLGGVLGLSFAAATINFLGARALLLRSFKVWAVAASLPFVFGLWNLQDKPSEHKRALLIQTGLFPHQKYPFAFSLDDFVDIEAQWDLALAHLQPADWIVFPESAFPFGAKNHVMSQEQVSKLLERHLAPPKTVRAFWSNSDIAQEIAFLTGSEVIIGLDDQDGEHMYNAAFHFSSDSPPTRFEKQRLLPVAETIPFEWLKGLARRYGIEDSFTAGEGARVAGAVPLSVSICYDECFSELVRGGRECGAQLLVNVSNDAWYPHTLLNKTQFEHGRLRAVENGVPLMRACNTGVSAAVDCYGRTLGSIDNEEPGSLLVDVPLYTYKTLYSSFGNTPLISLCLVLGLSYILRCLKKYESATLVEG